MNFFAAVPPDVQKVSDLPNRTGGYALLGTQPLKKNIYRSRWGRATTAYQTG